MVSMSTQQTKQKSATDREWERWGRQDAYRGVLGYGGEDESARAAFFASGERHVGHILETAEMCLGPPNWDGRALDFGCGVGRLLVPLSERFRAVVGVDVSPSMLDLARANLKEKANVAFAPILDDLVSKDEQFEFVHTFIVMQHIRPAQGMPILQQLIDLTAPGGIFAIHLTIGDLRKSRRAFNIVRYHFRPAHWFYNALRRRPLSEPITEMNRYDAARVFELFHRNKCGNLVASPLDHNGHIGVMFIGRKGSQIK
jgi:SAM-dependent methyltransferase